MSEQVKVAISSDFLTAFARLPKTIQGKVTEFLNKFRNDPMSPGIHYEKIAGGIDQKIYSVRIDNTYRGIVAREEETGVYLLLWVDHHDEAYTWAARKRCEVNPKTGALQIFDVQPVKNVIVDAGHSETEAGRSAAEAEHPETGAGHQVVGYKAPARSSIDDQAQQVHPLFVSATDDQLLELGVPQVQLSFVRSFQNQEEFIKAQASLPKDVCEYLSWLTEGIPVSEVLDYAKEERWETIRTDLTDTEETAAGSRQSTGSLADALKAPLSKKSIVIVEGEDELRRIMAEPLEKWRVFLHPSQRKIVNRSYNGPARVLGGAGTGKTVVAMHRAKHLADQTGDEERILFTTFTANLASDIKENLRKICSTEQLRKIEVINLDAWVNQFLRESDFDATIDYDNISKVWEDALIEAQTDLPFEAAFYEEEWNRVVIPQEALTLEKYLKASRNGRGTRLDRKKRMLVWKVMEAYQNLLKERKIRDINTAMYECRQLLESAGTRPRYAHIIVDEGQDFSDNAFRLLRALAGPEHPNDLFIVGDSHQRIYHNKPTLSRCGVNVRGRSSILRINYRTTEEIRRYAFALLDGIAFDDLDDGSDTGDRCQSLTHGSKPDVESFKGAAEEFEFIKKTIYELQDQGVALSDICLVARTKKLVDDYIAQLTHAGFRAYAIKRNKADDRTLEGIRVATMHRVKGLEFQYVFVAAVNKNIVPLASAIDKTDRVTEAETITAEKCLLYVALTRAQKGAYITSYGKKSPFLQG